MKVPLILGRPILATSQAFIDVKDGRMVLRIREEEVVSKLQAAMRHSMDFDDSSYFVDQIDDYVFDFVQDSLWKDGRCTWRRNTREIDQGEAREKIREN